MASALASSGSLNEAEVTKRASNALSFALSLAAGATAAARWLLCSKANSTNSSHVRSLLPSASKRGFAGSSSGSSSGSPLMT